jgi:hypothetical protein
MVPGQTPRNAVLLARGENGAGGGADMIYIDHATGGSVFSVGSINFGGSLLGDATLTKILRNVLDTFQRP